MDKTKLFMIVTAIISFVCIRFDKIVNAFISAVSANVYDSSVVPIGINYRSLPINVSIVMIDGKNFTNKFKLLAAWKWNFEANGLTKSDIELIKPDAKLVIIRACPRYQRVMKEYRIDLVNDMLEISDVNTISSTDTLKHASHDILFGEICLFPDI